MKHLIRKQVINLQLDASQDHFFIQQQARDYYYKHVAPAMEKLFDELCQEDEIIGIERFEIDLGNLGWKDERFTLDEVSIYPILKQSFIKTLLEFTTGAKPGVVIRRSPEENACLQWLYYMEKGRLPWQVQTIDERWLKQVLHQLAIDNVLIERTRRLIRNNASVSKRVVRDHEDTFLRQLVEVLTAKPHPNLISQIAQFEAYQSSFHTNETSPTKSQVWEALLEQVVFGKEIIDLHSIELLQKNLDSLQRQNEDKPVMEEIFCEYAGLVLLHPFLKHLFNRLLLLKDGLFRDIISQEKAVAILYFIVTGKVKARDYELIVPKIFCGIPIYHVMSEGSFLLTTTEMEESSNMMSAAIEQWEIIRNTSEEGLRESFLSREGKLLIKDSSIEFRIESKGIDVLLDHLPWNLSLIKFPWLDKLIHVEWR